VWVPATAPSGEPTGARLRGAGGAGAAAEVDLAGRSLKGQLKQASRLQARHALVVQEDGWVVPIQHGFGNDFRIARLGRGSFRSQAARWKREQYPRFLELTRNVWDDLRDAPEHLPFTNWYAAVTERSRSQCA